jgi:hypothetical protein
MVLAIQGAGLQPAGYHCANAVLAADFLEMKNEMKELNSITWRQQKMCLTKSKKSPRLVLLLFPTVGLTITWSIPSTPVSQRRTSSWSHSCRCWEATCQLEATKPSRTANNKLGDDLEVALTPKVESINPQVLRLAPSAY